MVILPSKLKLIDALELFLLDELLYLEISNSSLPLLIFEEDSF